MGRAWFGILLLSCLISLNGWCLAAAFNQGFLGKFLTAIAALMLVAGTAVWGAILGLHSLTGKIEQIPDGKNDVMITLRLGPFTYTRIVPKFGD